MQNNGMAFDSSSSSNLKAYRTELADSVSDAMSLATHVSHNLAWIAFGTVTAIHAVAPFKDKIPAEGLELIFGIAAMTTGMGGWLLATRVVGDGIDRVCTRVSDRLVGAVRPKP